MTLAAIAPLERDGVRLEITGEAAIAFTGEIAGRDPVAELQPHLRTIHDAVRGRAPALRIDVTGLRYVNSSALRLFLDWIAWIVEEPPPARYRLVFVTAAAITWQAAAFPALQSLGGEHVTVERT